MKLLDLANKYVEKSDWKTMLLLKICLFSAGIIVGTTVTKKAKFLTLCICMVLFVITYIPLMIKFFNIYEENKN